MIDTVVEDQLDRNLLEEYVRDVSSMNDSH